MKVKDFYFAGRKVLLQKGQPCEVLDGPLT